MLKTHEYVNKLIRFLNSENQIYICNVYKQNTLNIVTLYRYICIVIINAHLQIDGVLTITNDH